MATRSAKEATLRAKDCILVLIGLPASGKTTFVENFVAYLAKERTELKVVHVCYDALIPLEDQAAIARQESEEQWKTRRKDVVKAISAIVSGCDAEGGAKDVVEKLGVGEGDSSRLFIIDDNNYLTSMRYEYYQVARSHETGFCQLHFPSSSAAAIQRNSVRPSAVPESVIRRMADKLEPPNALANRWEQFSFSCQSAEVPFEMCLTVVDLAFSHPVKPLPEVDMEERDRSRAACSASVVHQADKLLRKSVTARVNSTRRAGSTSDLKTFSQGLNAARTEVLEDLKTGFTKLPVDVLRKIEKKEAEGIEELRNVVDGLFDLKIREHSSTEKDVS